ncbi:uncharacterized protein SCHCODRAFT_02486287 [Schizophyllum commune H4-8]|uniref:Uncharacterized protein n=1 Tax=Schizophyllum commune (strain H4-8 / FGSC 9210) TaxID=578458 RepID=D8PQQ3_SCHCM|nr:uncharacterized protein SCHCODRAFT_02492672 [Schizophyllum commune H4-8]XP_003037330.1 uncharacterized protein SCHCODRAFT_02486287 [Schizophyllum commune H4-8]KAI5897212.1 hypothetical protein SCHCODRAFT_02492672 [Schizophyllum commune H4-8]KAI5898156.1 hypothetical protein SCHCODRAFT_02486287 [Schizophyllum commune H4-8]
MALPFTRQNVNKQMSKLSFTAGPTMRPRLLALFGCDREVLSSQQKMLQAMSYDMNDVNVAASYPMHKAACAAILDDIGVITTSPLCLAQYNVVSTAMNIVIIAKRSVGPHETTDQYYHGLDAMLTTLQNAMTQIKATQAGSRPSGSAMTGVEATTAPAASMAAPADPAVAATDFVDPALATSAAAQPSSTAAAAASATAAKAKRGKKKEKVSADDPSTPSVPSKRSAESSTDAPPSKVQIFDVSDTGVAHFGRTGLAFEGVNGSRLIEQTLGIGAQRSFDTSKEIWARAQVVSTDQYGNGDLHQDSLYHALREVTDHLNTSSAFIGCLLASHEKLDSARQDLQSLLRKAIRRDEHLRRDPSEEADVPGSRRQGMDEGPYQADYDRVRDIRGASPESRHILETVERERFLADKKPGSANAEASSSAVPVEPTAGDAPVAMEVDVPAVEVPASRSASRARKSRSTRTSAKEAEE